jgi:hypothetical protein
VVGGCDDRSRRDDLPRQFLKGTRSPEWRNFIVNSPQLNFDYSYPLLIDKSVPNPFMVPVIGHPYGLVSPGMQCVVGGGPIPQWYASLAAMQ